MICICGNSVRAAAAFTPAQTLQINAMIHDYLVKNPSAVIDALKSYQDQEDQRDAQAFHQNIKKYQSRLITPDTPFAGNPQGTKTVIEFYDYNCPYCKKAVDDVLTLIKDDKNVKVYFKDYPILSPTSADAARWALAAGKQGKYFAFHVAMMKTPTPGEHSTEDMYAKIAKDLGLDIDKMRADAGSKEIHDIVQGNLDIGRDLGIHGTPAFIIRDNLYPGYMGLENMKKTLSGAAADAPSAP